MCSWVKKWGSICGILVISAVVALAKGGLSRGWFYEGGPMSYDKVGLVLGLLGYWVTLLVFLSSWSNLWWKYYLRNTYRWTVVWAHVLVQLALASCSWVHFFLFFEGSLIPVGFLILVWGNQPERKEAFVYMVMYGVGVASPFLVSLLWLSVHGGGWMYGVKETVKYGWPLQAGLLSAGLVKVPMYGLHVWLPKAHVEAPLGGSLILAGILLKLGGYQVYRVSVEAKLGYGVVNSVLLCVAIWGGFLTSVVCFRQVDIKALIAYSSVGHMSVVLGSLLLNTPKSVGVALSMMVGHAFVSCGLFSLAYVFSQVVGSRSLYYVKGMGSVCPALGGVWFLGCVLNMGFPPGLGFVSEVVFGGQLWSGVSWLLIPFGAMVFCSGMYNVFLFLETQHGSPWEGGGFGYSVTVRDYLYSTLPIFWAFLGVLLIPSMF